MITFSKLGKLGAMGNQLFQYAALYGLHKKTGFEMRIPKPPKNIKGELKILGHTKDGHPLEQYDNCLNYFEITSKFLSKKDFLYFNSPDQYSNNIFRRYLPITHAPVKHSYQEPHSHFDSEYFSIKDSTNIEGYFQSVKYFQHCQKEIRSEFTIKQKYRTAAITKLKSYNNNSELLISIHVRRLGHEKPEYQKIHIFPDIDYYLNAINYFNNKYNNLKFIIFSDDIEWCKHKFNGSDIQFSTGNSSIIDFAMMSLCDHHILTRSSFSWWASWLNNNPEKEVVGPRGKLFGPDGPTIMKDYFPEYIQLI